MASNKDGYWARSWALLTKDKGWIKPLLVLSAVQLIPIVGQLGASGYALEWGRLTAWGVDAAPKQKNVNISACIKSGARAFVVALGYTIVISIIRAIIGAIFGDILGGLLSIVIAGITAVLIAVVTLRATIYQSISAGFEVGRIADMVKRDYDGLLRIMGMVLLMSFCVVTMGSVLVSVVMLFNAGDIVREVMRLDNAGNVDDIEAAMMVLSWIASMLPLMFVAGYLIGIVVAGVNLLTQAATGLWMRQFDVQHWGQSHDPLPVDQPVGGYGAQPAAGAPAGGTYAAQTRPASYGQPTTGFGQPTPEQVAASQNFDIPQAYEPQQTQQAPQQTYDIPQAEEAPAAATPIFTLDDEPAPAPTAEQVPTFTLDDEPAAAPAVTPTEQVPTFTLDDEPTESAAAPAEPAVTSAEQEDGFSLDEVLAMPIEPAAEVPTFSLDDVETEPAALEQAVTPTPAAPVKTFSLDDLPSGVPVMPKPTGEPVDHELKDAIAQSRAFVDADLTEPVEVVAPSPASAPVEPEPAAELEPQVVAEPEPVVEPEPEVVAQPELEVVAEPEPDPDPTPDED